MKSIISIWKMYKIYGASLFQLHLRKATKSEKLYATEQLKKLQ
jgi:hypothetical protein